VSPVTGVFHCGITVLDLDRSLRFYRDALGLTVAHDRDTTAAYLGQILGLEHPDLRIAFLRIPGSDTYLELLEYRNVERMSAAARPWDPGGGHLCLFVSGVDDLHDAVVAAGYRVRSTPVDIASGPNAGARAVYVSDPDGHWVELMQPASADRSMATNGSTAAGRHRSDRDATVRTGPADERALELVSPPVPAAARGARAMSPSILKDFLARPLIAHVAVARDGEPRVIPMWFWWDGESVWLETFPTAPIVAVLRDNDQAAISIDENLGGFRLRSVVMRGRAFVVDEPAEVQRIVDLVLAKYLGASALATPALRRVRDEPHVALRFVPNHTVARDETGETESVASEPSKRPAAPVTRTP
jgi:lactoylglutathione lyase